MIWLYFMEAYMFIMWNIDWVKKQGKPVSDIKLPVLFMLAILWPLCLIWYGMSRATDIISEACEK